MNKSVSLVVLSLLAIATLVAAADPMFRDRPGRGELDAAVADPPPAAPAPDSGGYVCDVQIIGSQGADGLRGVQVYLTSGRNCAGAGDTFAAWISPPGQPGYSEAQVTAIQRDLLVAAREGWRVYVERQAGTAVIRKLTIRVS